MLAKSCVFGKQLAPSILCYLFVLLVLIIANLLSHFAEFLKDLYALTFVFSTCPLVSDWYSLLNK